MAYRTVVADIVTKRLRSTALCSQYGQRCFANISQHCLSVQPPKKPAGAFLKFMNDKSADILSRSPDASSSISQRSKVASQLWHDLDPKERNILKLRAKEELEMYQQRYMRFLAALSKQDREQLGQSRLDKKLTRALERHKKELIQYGKPKKPPNSFNLFLKASRFLQGSTAPPGFLKKAVRDWKQMPEEEKHVYQEGARLANLKYQQEMIHWEQKMRDIRREDLIRKKSQQKPKINVTEATKRTMVIKKSEPRSKSKS